MTVQRQNDSTHDTETVPPENQADRTATRRHFLMVATATRTNTPEAPHGNA